MVPGRGLSPPPDRVGTVFAALADPVRRHVVSHLAEGGAASATALAADLPISRQAVCKHLGLLESAGLVESTRCGREVRYSVSTAALAAAMAWMVRVGGDWDDRLAALSRHLQAHPAPPPAAGRPRRR